MKPASLFASAALFMATIALTFTATGCSKPKDETKVASPEPTKPVEPTKKEPIKAGTASIKGKVVFGSEPPAFVKSKDIEANKECTKCILQPQDMYMDGEQMWIFGKNKEVANVLVRLKVPTGHYFEPSDADKSRKDKVELDQPCCAFVPHVLVLNPSYFDGAKQKPTGQVLVVKNSAPFQHNTKINGDSRAKNDKGESNARNEIIPPKTDGKVTEKELVLAPEAEAIGVECNVHTMMKAKFFVYDHPYAVVTKMDGAFVLKNVPVGKSLTVEFWHEAKQVFHTVDITLTEKEDKDLGVITIK
jgi:hypothetical protein